MPTRPITYAAIAGALAAPVLAMTPASATSGPVGSAFGISASGLVNVAPMPSVTSTGTKKHEIIWKHFPSNPVLKPMAIAWVNARSGNHTMAALNYIDIRTPKVALPAGTPKLPTDIVLAKVAAARCDNGKGTVVLTEVKVAGKTIKVRPAANTRVDVAVLNLGKVTATLNKQVHNANGTLTVTAIELNITLGGKSETVDISSATCGRPVKSTPAPAPAPGGEAPVPTPVKSDLPVTG